MTRPHGNGWSICTRPLYHWCRRGLSAEDTADVFRGFGRFRHLVGFARIDRATPSAAGCASSRTTRCTITFVARNIRPQRPAARCASLAAARRRTDDEDPSGRTSSACNCTALRPSAASSSGRGKRSGRQVDNRSTDDVAAELGQTAAAVQAKYRVLRRPREAMSELLA